VVNLTLLGVDVVEGDATDRAAVSQAMKGADAVISVLGARGPVRSSPKTEQIGLSQKISRADVASFLLQAAADDLYSRAGVVITG
jgi:uncharacterized protein YbjT (DUF2867 family)